jgi:hypothetical protein
MKKIILVTLLLFVTSPKISNFVFATKVESTDKIREQVEKTEFIKRQNLIIAVLSYQESTNNANALNVKENAVGILQIRPIMIKEVNLLVGHKKYTLEDRWDPEKSIEIFKDFQNKVNPEWDEELACKKWNGGRKGELKKSTEKYYQSYLSNKKYFLNKTQKEC